MENQDGPKLLVGDRSSTLCKAPKKLLVFLDVLIEIYMHPILLNTTLLAFTAGPKPR